MSKLIIYCVLCLSALKGMYGGPVGEPQRSFYFPVDTDAKSNKQYYYGTIYLGNIFQAIQFCNYHHMELLSIETVEENNFLFISLEKFIGHGTYEFWSSGTLLPENHWVWLSTGKPIVHPNWTAHPYNKNKKCIGVAYMKTSKTITWIDADCNEARHFICESTKV